MEAGAEGDSHVEMTMLVGNKIVTVNDYRSLCILTKLALDVVYKDRRVARNRKRSQYLKSPYIDMDKLRKHVDKFDSENRYCSFKKDCSHL